MGVLVLRVEGLGAKTAERRNLNPNPKIKPCALDPEPCMPLYPLWRNSKPYTPNPKPQTPVYTLFRVLGARSRIQGSLYTIYVHVYIYI